MTATRTCLSQAKPSDLAQDLQKVTADMTSKVSRLPVRCPGATHHSNKQSPPAPVVTGRKSRLPVRRPGPAHQSNKQSPPAPVVTGRKSRLPVRRPGPAHQSNKQSPPAPVVTGRKSRLPVRRPGPAHQSNKQSPPAPVVTGRKSRLPVRRPGPAHKSNTRPPSDNVNNNGLNGKTKPGADKKTTKLTLNRQKVKPATIKPDNNQDHRHAIERRIQEIEAQNKLKPYVGLFGSHLPPLGSTAEPKHIPGAERLPNMGFVFGSHGPAVPRATPLPIYRAEDSTPRQNTDAINKMKSQEPAMPKPRPPTAKAEKCITQANASSRQLSKKGSDVNRVKKRPPPSRPPSGHPRGEDKSRVAKKNTKDIRKEESIARSSLQPKAKSDRKPRPPTARSSPVPPVKADTPIQRQAHIPRPPTAKASAKRRPPVQTKPHQDEKAARHPSARKATTTQKSPPDKFSPRPTNANNAPSPAKPLMHTPNPPAPRADGMKARPFPGQIAARRTHTTPRPESAKPAASPITTQCKDKTSNGNITKIAERTRAEKKFGPSDYEIRKAVKADSDDEENYDYEDDFEDDESDCESLESLTEANTNANHEMYDINKEDISVYIERVDTATLLTEYTRWKATVDKLRAALVDADKELDDMLAWYRAVQAGLGKQNTEADLADKINRNGKTESERAKNRASDLENNNDDIEANNKDEQIDLIDKIRNVNTMIQMMRAFKGGRLDARIHRIKDGKCAKALLQTELMQADLDALKDEYRELKINEDDDDEYERESKKATIYDIDNCLGAFRKIRPVKITKGMTIGDIKATTKKDASELVDTEDLDEDCTLEVFMRERRCKMKTRNSQDRIADTQKGHMAETDTEYTVQEEIIELDPESATVATYSDNYRMAHNRQIQQYPTRNNGLFPSIKPSDTREPTIEATPDSQPNVDLPSMSRSGPEKLLKRRRKNI